MKIAVRHPAYNFSASDVVVFFLPEDYEKAVDSHIIPELSFIIERADLSSFKGKSSEVLFIPFKKYPNIIITGLGKKNKITKESIRENAGAIVRLCKKNNIPRVHIITPAVNKMEETAIAVSITEGLVLSDYAFDKYKSVKEDETPALKNLGEIFLYSGNRDAAAKAVQEASIICKNTNLCRDLVNESSEVSNPVAIAKEAGRLSKIKSVTCRIYNKKDIEKFKMGLLLAVSKGSSYPPQLVVLKYKGNPGSKKQIAIIGKGITYDSGGMNLKPSASIEDMRSDMAGAAACLYALRSAAELKLKKNITAVIPLCENMLSSNSYRAGDVFNSYSGMNIEVGNTDAEGRLILADAVAYTEKMIKPDYIIDIATLTGACLVCFGESIAALFSSNDKLADDLFMSGVATGEKLWRMPLDKDYEDMIRSDIADIRNVGQGRNAGTIVGATFIKKFVKDTDWAHIDIAGTAWLSKAKGYKPKYATGFGVRLFVELFKNIEL